MNRAWLKARGFNRPRVDYALRAGKLTAVAHGIYRRPGPAFKWEHVVYSLNQMGWPVRVGGRSALELQGMAHYLPLGDTQRIDLYGGGKVPPWVRSFQASIQFTLHTVQFFDPLPGAAMHHRPFRAWDWPIPFSLPELALLELLAGVRHGVDFYMADKFFESAVNLRPGVLRDQLLACTQVKAKRLFLWFSDRRRHAWRQALDTQGVDLGRGKRLLVKGGAYDAAYLITVARKMAVGEEQPLY